MNRISYIACASAFLILFSGCGKEEPLPEELPVAVGFTPSLTDTRGTGITDANLSSIGVFASFTKGGGFDASTSVPDFMWNLGVTKDASSGAWTYSPVRYWPGNATDKISFFAYAPYNAVGITPSAVTQKGYPFVTYAPAAADDAQTDLLAAVPVMNRNLKTDGSSVGFVLQHALTRIAFKVKSGLPGAVIVVRSLSVVTLAQAKLAFCDPLATGADGKGFAWSWEASPSMRTYTGTVNGGSITLADSPVSVGASFFLIPVGDPSVQTMLVLEYTLDKGDGKGAVGFTATRYLPADLSWTPGVSISYTVSVADDRLEIGAGGIGLDGFTPGSPTENPIPAT